ncbi:MAG: RimK family alpha-L-glutamate ligase [Cyclobacteriaceae bacterium]
MTDITLLTDLRYVNPTEINWYKQNILDDDNLVRAALEKYGLTVKRTNWDNPEYDWTQTRYAVFRTTWDYFDRFTEFSSWLDLVSTQTKLINPLELVRGNMDKHYLCDLQNKGINIPPTVFIETGDERTLAECVFATGWRDCILKPAVSGAARHTYRLNRANLAEHEAIFRKLIRTESMLIQEFQQQVIHKGEVAFMVFGGKYSHAVLKKAKPGDFRVQDDFGGTVHDYKPSSHEIEFAEKVVSICRPKPVYARVDMIWDNNNNVCVSELELIEPELWFRKYPKAANLFAQSLLEYMG